MSEPVTEQQAICKHCRRTILRLGDGEWRHYPGSTYCQTANGFTNSALLTAAPMSHPDEGFDEADYDGSYSADGKTVFGPASVTKDHLHIWACKRCATVTNDRGKHDQYCPARKPLR